MWLWKSMSVHPAKTDKYTYIKKCTVLPGTMYLGALI